MIADVNCSTGTWPFRNYGPKKAAELDKALLKEGIDIGMGVINRSYTCGRPGRSK